MISRAAYCFPNGNASQQAGSFHQKFSSTTDHQDDEVVVSSPVDQAVPNTSTTTADSHYSTSLLYNLSILRDKLNQVQSLVGLIINVSPQGADQPLALLLEPTSIALGTINSLMQETIAAASSIMFTCQQVALNIPPPNSEQRFLPPLPQPNINIANINTNRVMGSSVIISQDRGQSVFSSSDQTLDWLGESYGNSNCNNKDIEDRSHVVVMSEITNNGKVVGRRSENGEGLKANYTGREDSSKGNGYDIIELDAADLLAKYTHYCQVCAKGFKRDANLRMHMRAHGDEYKTSAALSNPIKNHNGSGLVTGHSSQNDKVDSSGDVSLNIILPKKYSCPQEGCRWNRRHPKFQPLKSVICVKNHYKRSHCPKMYVCKRCNQKQFSVLSDLRTHEKHCGDLKWQCSCGTTFSRKDKLMGHLALFVGHAPATIGILSNGTKAGKVKQQAVHMQMDDGST